MTFSFKKIGLVVAVLALAGVPLYSGFFSSSPKKTTTPSSKQEEQKKTGASGNFFSNMFFKAKTMVTSDTFKKTIQTGVAKAKDFAGSGAGAAIVQKVKGKATGLVQKTKLGRKLLGTPAPEQQSQQTVAPAQAPVPQPRPAVAVSANQEEEDFPVAPQLPKISDVVSDGSDSPAEGNDADDAAVIEEATRQVEAQEEDLAEEAAS